MGDTTLLALSPCAGPGQPRKALRSVDHAPHSPKMLNRELNVGGNRRGESKTNRGKRGGGTKTFATCQLVYLSPSSWTEEVADWAHCHEAEVLFIGEHHLKPTREHNAIKTLSNSNIVVVESGLALHVLRMCLN